MSGNTDTAKGRVKQTVGALTGNEKLKRDGRGDERAGRAKHKADDAIDVVRDKVEDVATTLRPNDKER